MIELLKVALESIWSFIGTLVLMIVAGCFAEAIIRAIPGCRGCKCNRNKEVSE